MDLTLGMPKVIKVLHSKLVTRKVTKGENIKEPEKYISAYIKDVKS